MQVRAGAREPEQAFQFLRNAIAFGLLPKDAEKSITVVKFDLEDPESLPPAIGNATKVTAAFNSWGQVVRILWFAGTWILDHGEACVQTATATSMPCIVLGAELVQGQREQAACLSRLCCALATFQAMH